MLRKQLKVENLIGCIFNTRLAKQEIPPDILDDDIFLSKGYLITKRKSNLHNMLFANNMLQ